jgi:hypothetical protein
MTQRQELDLLLEVAKRDADLESRLAKSRQDKATVAAGQACFC